MSARKPYEDETPNTPQNFKTIFCDSCRKRKAAKSCLSCESSFCELHLESHDAPNLKKHKLIDPVENPKMICKQHGLSLDLFCKTDKVLVCDDCVKGDHKLHETASAEEESKKAKYQLVNTTAKVLQKVQEKEKNIEDIKLSVKQMKKNTEKETAECIEVFTDLENCVKRNKTWLIGVMEEKQKTAKKEAEEVIKELEQEISDLKRRDIELEELSHAEDLLHLPQIHPSVCSPPHTKDWTDTSIKTAVSADTLRRSLTQLEESFHKTMEKITEIELKSAQQYAVNVTLDPNTAHPNLILSGDGKKVDYEDTEWDLPDNPERFDLCLGVLGKQGFSSGRFYYEVQVAGKTEWVLGVATESVNRKNVCAECPENGYWTVLRDGNVHTAQDGSSVPLSLKQKPQKVGVFVDCEEGLVSFYDVIAKSHIYSFTGQSFTEKLYPYFNPCRNNGGKNSAPLIITPVIHNK